MSFLKSVRPASRLMFLSVLCVALAFVGVQVGQWRLRSRAELLLADMRKLQSKEGTWPDAQNVMKRWRPWGLGESSCISQECFYYVRLRDPVDSLIRGDLDGPTRFPYLVWPAQILGEKFTLVEASLRVKSGIVEESRFRVNFFGQDEGIAIEASAPNALDNASGRWQHPDYYADKHAWCEGCVRIETGFTPFAGKQKIGVLTDFNLSCITRWSSCTSEADIMPSAWKLFQEELPQKATSEKAFNDCSIPLEFFGGESHAIAVVDVLSRQGPTPKGDTRGAFARLRFIRGLKGRMPWSRNRTLIASNESSGEEVFWTGTPALVAGKRYILFGDIADGSVGENVLWPNACGIVPHNEQNLAAIQRGISLSLIRRLPAP